MCEPIRPFREEKKQLRKENQRGIPPPGQKDTQSIDKHGKTTVWTSTMTKSQTVVIHKEYRYSILVSMKNKDNNN